MHASNSYISLRKAASAGRGIGLQPVRLIAGDLAAGDLVPVLPDCDAPAGPSTPCTPPAARR